MKQSYEDRLLSYARNENLYSCVKKKYAKVIIYIESLLFHSIVSYKQEERFEKIRNEALSKETPEEMLDVIGYQVKGEDEIFIMARSVKK